MPRRRPSCGPIHLAMLASMMANRGELTTPRLVRERRSILGEVVEAATAQGKTRIASAAAAEKMIAAMQAVAKAPHGTGRRAPVEGITMAMKTGTAGVRQEGLDGLIMAFAPVDNPRIAFGVIAEGAGPAEFAGAQIAHDFLEQMKPRLGNRRQAAGVRRQDLFAFSDARRQTPDALRSSDCATIEGWPLAATGADRSVLPPHPFPCSFRKSPES